MTTYTNFLKLRAQDYNAQNWDVMLNESLKIVDFAAGFMRSPNRLLKGFVDLSGLFVDNEALVYEINGQEFKLPSGSTTMPASSLVFIYLSTNGLMVSTSPPAGDFIPLAVADTNTSGLDRYAYLAMPEPMLLAPRENLLFNPEFTVNQENYAADGTATLADQEYGHDMWKNVTGSTQKYVKDSSGNIDLGTMELGQKNDDIMAADGLDVTLSVESGALQAYGLGLTSWQNVLPSSPLTWTLDAAGNSGWLTLKRHATIATFKRPKLEVGYGPSKFQPRLITAERMLCFGYFWERNSLGFEQGTNHQWPTFPVSWPVAMRAVPTVTVTLANNYDNAAVSSAGAWGINSRGIVGINWDVLPGANGPYRFAINITADARY